MISCKETRQILEEIVGQGFSELSDVDFKIEFINKKSDFMFFSTEDDTYIIEVSKSIRKAPNKDFVGCLAHEVSHALLYYDSNPLTRIFDELLYNSFRLYQTFDERRTDRIVISRGYGSELLAFNEWNDLFYEERDRSAGLTKGEIKRLLKNS